MKCPKSSIGQKISLIYATFSLSNLIIWGINSSQVIAQSTISEMDIVTFISQMEYHTNQGNVEELVKYIDQDASIAIASEVGVEPALVRIENLRTFFDNGFQDVDSYEIDLKINEIVIEDQVATVTGTTVDHSIKGNVETVYNLLWRNVIEMKEGEMKIIQWESIINGYSVRMIEQ
ncbi:MAG: hypothetical protein AB4372_11420 [Xenococcus sp. (in: cyanobacteria)]